MCTTSVPRLKLLSFCDCCLSVLHFGCLLGIHTALRICSNVPLLCVYAVLNLRHSYIRTVCRIICGTWYIASIVTISLAGQEAQQCWLPRSHFCHSSDVSGPLQETVAVTHNYVSTVNLPHVLKFLRSGRQDLVSGCAVEDRALLHDKFVAALQAHNPQALAAARLSTAGKHLPQHRLSDLFADAKSGKKGFQLGTTSSDAIHTFRFF